MLSARVADGLPERPGTRVELTLKGKSEPCTAYRVTPHAEAGTGAD